MTAFLPAGNGQNRQNAGQKRQRARAGFVAFLLQSRPIHCTVSQNGPPHIDFYPALLYRKIRFFRTITGSV
jgi:hypothetical protein